MMLNDPQANHHSLCVTLGPDPGRKREALLRTVADHRTNAKHSRVACRHRLRVS